MKAKTILVEWDPYTNPILSDVGGEVHFKDIIDGVTVQEETDNVTGLSQQVVIESKDPNKEAAHLRPRERARSPGGRAFPLPSGAHIQVKEGDKVLPGHDPRQDPARDLQDPRHRRRSAPRRRALRGPASQDPGGHHRDRRRGPLRGDGRAACASSSWTTRARASATSTPSPRARTSASSRASGCTPATRCARAPWTRTTSSASWASRSCRSTS